MTILHFCEEGKSSDKFEKLDINKHDCRKCSCENKPAIIIDNDESLWYL